MVEGSVVKHILTPNRCCIDPKPSLFAKKFTLVCSTQAKGNYKGSFFVV